MGASTCMSNNSSRTDKNGNPIVSGTKSDWKNKKKGSSKSKGKSKSKSGILPDDPSLLESQNSNSTSEMDTP